MHSESPFPSDPLHQVRVARRLVRGIGLVLAAFVSWWAWRVPALRVPDLRTESVGGTVAETKESGPVSGADVDVLLWHPLPEEAAALAVDGAAAPRESQVSWQLVGICEDSGRFIAALYDPKANHLLMLGEGAEVGPYRLTKVGRESVQLVRGGDTEELRLPKDGNP